MLSSVADFFYTFLEGGLDSDDDDEKTSESSSLRRESTSNILSRSLSGSNCHKRSPFLGPHPGAILRIKKSTSHLPPLNMRQKPPAHVTVNNCGTRAFPKGMGAGGWVPTGCGCLVDKTKMIKVKRRGREWVRPKCVLNTCQIHELVESLPASVRWQSWCLIFSADEHGSSMKKLQSEIKGKSNILMVIQSTDDMIIGAYLSEAPVWRPETFVGSGETFVWRFDKGNLNCFRWDGNSESNSFISTTHNHAIGVGGGLIGSHAIYIDSDLRIARTGKCPTFNSPPLIPTADGSEAFFVIKNIEFWGFDNERAVSPVEYHGRSLLRDTPSPTPSPMGSSCPSMAEFDDCDDDIPLCQWHLEDSNHHNCYLLS